MLFEMYNQSKSIINKADSSDFDDQIPDILDRIEWKTINVVSDEPLEDPHGLIQHEVVIQMIVQLRIHPFQHILEDERIDVGKGKAIFVKTKNQVSPVDGKMHEHPKGIGLRIADQQQITNDEVNALSVAHGGEVVRDPLEHIFENLLFFHLELESSIQIFFYLREALMVLGSCLNLMVRLVLHEARVVANIFLVRYDLFFIPNLKTEAFFVDFISFVKSVQEDLPFFHDGAIHFLISAHDSPTAEKVRRRTFLK